MRKIVSVFALGVAFTFGSQTIQAQAKAQVKDAPREAAKEQVVKLDKILDLDQKQEEIIYRAYVAYEINTDSKKVSLQKKEDRRNNMIKNETSLTRIMKKTLSSEQYEKYQMVRRENMSDEQVKIMKYLEKKNSSHSLKQNQSKK